MENVGSDRDLLTSRPTAASDLLKTTSGATEPFECSLAAQASINNLNQTFEKPAGCPGFSFQLVASLRLELSRKTDSVFPPLLSSLTNCTVLFRETLNGGIKKEHSAEFIKTSFPPSAPPPFSFGSHFPARGSCLVSSIPRCENCRSPH